MKKYALGLMTVAVVAALSVVILNAHSEQLSAAQPTEYPDENVYISKERVAVRFDPSLSSDIKCYAAYGEKFYMNHYAGPGDNIDGIDDTWYYIANTDHSKRGWVFGNDISFQSTEQGMSGKTISNVKKLVEPSAIKIVFDWSRMGDMICFATSDHSQETKIEIQVLDLASGMAQKVGVVSGYLFSIKNIDDGKWMLHAGDGDVNYTAYEIALSTSGKYAVVSDKDYELAPYHQTQVPSEEELMYLNKILTAKGLSDINLEYFNYQKDDKYFFAQYQNDKTIMRLDIRKGSIKDLTLTSGANASFSKIGKHPIVTYPVSEVLNTVDVVGDDLKRLFQIYGTPHYVERSDDNDFYVYSVNSGHVQLYDLRISTNIEFKRIITDKLTDIKIHGDKVAFTKIDKGSPVLFVGDIVQ